MMVYLINIKTYLHNGDVLQKKKSNSVHSLLVVLHENLLVSKVLNILCRNNSKFYALCCGLNTVLPFLSLRFTGQKLMKSRSAVKTFHHKSQKLWEEALLLLILAFKTAFYDCVFYTSEIISVEGVTASLKVNLDLTV